MMKRRSFLIGASALTLGQLASGCNTQEQASLRVRLLKNSIPAQLVGEFRKELKQSGNLKFDPEEQLQTIFTRLQTWKQQAEKKDNQQQWSIPFIGRKTPAIANLVTLGDYWLAAAIAQQLIQPLDIKELKGWEQLPQRWKELVIRNANDELSNSEDVWGAPYRFGTTVIAYRRDKFEAHDLEPPKDWSDLWNPKLQGHISLLDEPREIIGLTLKKLGFSYNTLDLNQVSKLKEELLALHKLVKFYSSNNYLQPLVLEDTWLAVGWSTEVLPVLPVYRQIEAVVPLSGTALWADLWVQPVSVAAGSKGKFASITEQWIDFCWQPKPVREISLFSNAVSPILMGLGFADIPTALQKNPLLLPPTSVLDKSEFLEPLPESAVKQYQALWKEIRMSKVQPSSI